jgi:hypothetical protein
MDGTQPEHNGTPGWVHFADGNTDLIPADWAEDIIRLLYADHRGIFGALMLKRLGIDRLPRNRATA